MATRKELVEAVAQRYRKASKSDRTKILEKRGRIYFFAFANGNKCVPFCLTGIMTGLLGIGGGFVIVPMLRRFTNVSMHGIVATSLLVIALVGTGGA